MASNGSAMAPEGPSSQSAAPAGPADSGTLRGAFAAESPGETVPWGVAERPEAGRDRIGRYEILAELGRGAMGIVFKARDPQLDRMVAIKALRCDPGLAPELHADLRRRLSQEALAAGRLNHPNIVGIYDVLEVDEVPYIVMEYVEGQTLAHVLAAEAPLDPQRAANVALQVCAALEYAHGRGIVHRDIKPANLLVAGGEQVKVSDFGIARIAGSKLTQTGTMLGSPAYMSPEQVRGREVDGRSDLFALGVVLYEALTGAEPFPGENPTTVLYRILHEDPVPIRELSPSVSSALDAVIQRALAKEPQQRYVTARAFAEALREAQEQPAGRVPTSRQATVVLERASRPSRVRLAAIGAACLLGATIAGAAFWNGRSASGTPPPQQSRLPEGGPPRIVASQDAAATALSSDAGGPPARESGLPEERRSASGRRASQERAPSRSHGNGGELPSNPGGTGSKAPVPRSPQPPWRPGARVGSIRVTTDPAVEVYLDGEFQGRAGGEPFAIEGVPQGERVVSLRLGALEERFPRAVQEGQTLSLTYYFPANSREAAGEKPRATQAAPRSEAWGCLSINALPFGSVYVDGAYASEAPKACLRVAAGERRIQFEANGERSPERTLRVAEQHTAQNPLTIGYDFRARRYLE